jgi:hypothetical protein
MKTTATIVFLAIAALTTATIADARSGKHERRSARAQQPNQIACTAIGCVEVPRGCGQVPGKTWSGMPTGNDVVVCPPGVSPFPLKRR